VQNKRRLFVGGTWNFWNLFQTDFCEKIWKLLLGYPVEPSITDSNETTSGFWASETNNTA
jgi:hypothetical protein